MNKALTLSLTAGVLLLAGTAIAQTPQATSTPAAARAPLAEMTRDVAQQHATQMFARLDANADGQLDTTDRAERIEDRAEARFETIDADNNGTISREEFAAMADMRREGRGEGRRGGEGRMGHGMGQGMGRGGELIGAADADSNGAVTQAEFNSAFLARFDSADANDDGTVTAEERRAARPEGPGRGRGHRGMGR